jgi:hypothetical protein
MCVGGLCFREDESWVKNFYQYFRVSDAAAATVMDAADAAQPVKTRGSAAAGGLRVPCAARYLDDNVAVVRANGR